MKCDRCKEKCEECGQLLYPNWPIYPTTPWNPPYQYPYITWGGNLTGTMGTSIDNQSIN